MFNWEKFILKKGNAKKNVYLDIRKTIVNNDKLTRNFEYLIIKQHC